MELTESITLFLEKNVPTDPKKWQKWVGKAKKKFDVYPSAYANGWAAKMYKGDGGGWKNESEEPQHVAAGLPQTKELKGKKIGERFIEYLEDNGLKHAAYQTESGEIKIVGLNKEQVKDALKDVVKEYKKLKEVGLPGGAGVGVSLPGGYINGAPDEKDVKNIKSKLKEAEEGEGESKKFPGHYHLGGGYYSTSKDGEAVKKSDKGQLRALTPQEKQQKAAEKSGATAQQKPAPPQKTTDKKPQATKPAVQTPITPSVQPQTQPSKPSQPTTPVSQKPDTSKMSPEDKKATDEFEQEKEGLDHEEKAVYEFLDGIPEEQKQDAINQALNNRSWWQKFTQDTVVGGWMKKKGQQLADTGRAMKSLFKHRGKFGGVEDCSGAPSGPHARIKEIIELLIKQVLLEKGEDRGTYLAGLGRDGKPKEPENKGECKSVHYTDYMKRDEKGDPVYEEVEEEVFEPGGGKPDPEALKGGAYYGGLGTGYIGPRKAGTEYGGVSQEDAFKASELDSQTGFFKRDEKYYDKNGEEVDKKGNIVGPDGKPKPVLDKKGNPKKKTVKVPVYEDGLTPEQLDAAHKSHHAKHEQIHALKHTAIEIAVIGVSVASGGWLAGLGGAAKASAEGGALTHAMHLAVHTLKDIGKHAAAEMMGAPDAFTAGSLGAAATIATAGVLENRNKMTESLLIILEAEGSEEQKNKAFMEDLIKKTLERMKTYKMTPQQKLQSIKDYKKKKAEGGFEKKEPTSMNESVNKHRVKEIGKFVEFTTKRLKLNERPKIKLVKEAEYLEKVIFQDGSSALGGYIPSQKTIMVVNGGRLIADVLRTIAHEMVHRKQEELGMLDDIYEAGKTGSPIENQANSIAGILLREYGKNNKMIYKEIKEIQTEIDDIYTQTVFLKEYITHTI